MPSRLLKLILPVWDNSTVSVVGKFNVNQYSIALIILPQYQEHTHTTKSYRSTLRLSNSWQQHARMEKLAENDLTYFYLRHVVIVVTAFTPIILPPVIYTIIVSGSVNLNNKLLLLSGRNIWCPCEKCQEIKMCTINIEQ